MAHILFTIADAVMNALAYSTTHVFVQSFKYISYFFLIHLREHKLEHDFQDTLNPLCSCGNDVESTEHFLLHCPQFGNEKGTPLSTR